MRQERPGKQRPQRPLTKRGREIQAMAEAARQKHRTARRTVEESTATVGELSFKALKLLIRAEVHKAMSEYDVVRKIPPDVIGRIG